MSLKTSWQTFFPKVIFTKLLGRIAKVKLPILTPLLIGGFVRFFKINLQDAKFKSTKDYDSLEALFTRKLEDNSRPIDIAPIVSPCDGTISEMGHLTNGMLVQAKGVYYPPDVLLANHSNSYTSFATIYLAPHDYHRVHAPLDVELKSIKHIPGELFSVNQASAEEIPSLFNRNERVVFEFHSHLGSISLVMVAAMGVGHVVSSYYGELDAVRCAHINAKIKKEPHCFAKGEELAFFNLGSTVIVMFDAQLDALKQSGDVVKLGEGLFGRQD